MKAVILAGGLGTRISEETSIRPKPMVEIGAMPILWHIMKIYSSYDINDFVVLCGYKGHVIKEFFQQYLMRCSTVRFDLAEGHMEILDSTRENWRITLVDTGDSTMTGGRIKRARDYIGDDTFCLTYGDGVCDVNVSELVDFHRKKNATVTLTAVQPEGRFGAINLAADQSQVLAFEEKPEGDNAWINGGYFIVEPEAIDQIADDDTSWEREPLSNIAKANGLFAYKHNGFWHPMDTLRDKNHLANLWQKNNAPWKVW